jgi:hypothetical protein
MAVKRLRNSDGAKIPLKKRSSAGKEPPRKIEIIHHKYKSGLSSANENTKKIISEY